MSRLLRARIVAARTLLATVDGEIAQHMSTIQATALNDILQAEVWNFTAERKLSLADEVTRVGLKRNRVAMLLQTRGSGCSVGLG